MRVITAIYVFCNMTLRDEWISGSQGLVDEWIDAARDVERSWRGLCGWWHGRMYREALGSSSGSKKVETDGDGDGDGVTGSSGRDDLDSDFFARELEKMGWSIGGLIDDGSSGSAAGGSSDGGVHVGGIGNGNGNGNGEEGRGEFDDDDAYTAERDGNRNGNGNGNGNGRIGAGEENVI